jgi:2'-5' RNA ligase
MPGNRRRRYGTFINDAPAMQQDKTTHRCFYAVKFSPEVTRYIATVMEELRRHRADVKWTAAQNIHLTLRFLGEIDDRALRRAEELPDQEEPSESMLIRAEGLGAFPLLRAPRTLWTGVAAATEHDMDQLRHLQKRTETWAQRIGLPAENRRFSPHVTLGRVRQPSASLKDLMDDLIARECRSELCRVDELLLLRSTLDRSGPTYETLKSWKLKENG